MGGVLRLTRRTNFQRPALKLGVVEFEHAGRGLGGGLRERLGLSSEVDLMVKAGGGTEDTTTQPFTLSFV